jgi:hypothetical protein
LLSTVIQGAILFHLADAGFSPKQMLIVASTGLPNIYSRLQTLKAAMSFGGIAEREKPKVWLDDMFLFSSVPYRFLVIRHLPGARSMSVDEFQDTVVKCKDFDALREIIEAGGSNTVIDLHNLADQIAERAGLPLFRIEIVDCPENEELLKSVRDKTEDGVNLDAVRELFSDARAALREKGLL